MTPKFPDLIVTPKYRHGVSVGFKSALFSLSLGLVMVAPAAHGQSAADVLNQVKQSEAKIQYSATQVVQHGSDREVAKIYRSGAKRRLEWLAPSVKKGDVLVDDGHTVTLFHRSDKTAIQTQSVHRSLNFSGGDWKVDAPKLQSGHLVRVLSRPNGRKLVIDAGTKAIIRMEGMRGVTILENIDYGMVPASRFVFTLPAGATLQRVNGQLFSDLRAARKVTPWFKAPTQLPAGYSFESAIVGPSEVWLRYTNGLKRFSIFQQKADGGDLAPKKVEGSWFWKSGGLRFLASDAPESAIPALAASLK